MFNKMAGEDAVLCHLAVYGLFCLPAKTNLAVHATCHDASLLQQQLKPGPQVKIVSCCLRYQGFAQTMRIMHHEYRCFGTLLEPCYIFGAI